MKNYLMLVIACTFALVSCSGNSHSGNNREGNPQNETSTQDLNTTNAISDGWKDEGSAYLIKRNGNPVGYFPIQSKGNRMRVYMDYQFCNDEYLKVRLNPDYNPYSSGQPLRCKYMAGPYYIKNL